jgi:hypothetical protein
MMKSLLVVLTLCLSVSAFGKQRPKVVYGQDDRRDIGQVTNQAYLDMSRATAAMVPMDSLKLDTSVKQYILTDKVKTLATNDLKLCKNEPYANQPDLSMCSGFLVGPDLLVTAGHCTNQVQDACKSYRWVFGYQVENGQNPTDQSFGEQEVYNCKEVVHEVFDPFGSGLDFSIIRLDRPVRDRQPLEIRKEGKVENAAKLVVMGYPWGLPLKISPNGSVLANTDSAAFYTSLDTFQGNSGSAVINMDSGEVEGVLVNGKTDFYVSFQVLEGANGKQTMDRCRRVNRCDDAAKNCNAADNQQGEGVTRITHLAELIEKALK